MNEILVIGAGLIGSSVAMHLAQKGLSDVRVVDFDLEGSLSSSELNAGGVRATWVQPLNIRMSQISIEYFAEHATEVGYRDVGYLWLHTPERLPHAMKARERQVEMGWPVEAWDVAELRRRIPFIDKTDDLAGALFAPRDGLVNPNRLKNHFREKARALGVVFEDRVRVRSVEYDANGTARVRAERFSKDSGEWTTEGKAALLSGRESAAEPVEFRARRVVNCAGAWAPRVARALGYACPSKAVRRQVSIFDCRDVDLTKYGMIVEPSGVYFHPEATNGLAGFGSHDEPPGENFAYDGESFFQERIWPALYERSSGFERLRHVTGWAGLYEVSPDESGIVGRVSVSSLNGPGAQVYEAHSFSGHGVMHSYSAGLGLAELIVSGRYETLDLAALSGIRFDEGKPLLETLVI